ncbi:MAG: MFS transporter [Acetobacteraceae bacterium]
MAVRRQTQAAASQDRSLALTVAIAAAIMAVSMGLRQCFGLFQAAVTVDLAISATTFGFAVALHNLVWGLSQPILGIVGDSYGPRPVLVASGLIYAAGLGLMATSRGAVLGLDIGIGLMTGIGIAGTGFGVLLGAVSRAAPPERRSQLIGLVSGVGSIGVLGLAPLGQHLIQIADWRTAAAAYAVICLSIVILSLFIGGRAVEAAGDARETTSAVGARAAALEALGHGGFLAMTTAFFACGFQLMFITTHLPRYLGICGLPPSLGAASLGIIGACNAVGSYVFGLLGARFSRKRLLAGIYATRTIAIVAYVAAPVSEATTLIFAAVMGFTWLGVVPLVSGLIVKLFGLRHFNMLFGLVFLLHQAGGFLGPWMGGIILDSTGDYTIAWYAMIVVGLAATVLQWPMNDDPSRRPRSVATASAA